MIETRKCDECGKEMNPHDRKHALNPRRIDLKGGHHHRRNYCICSQCGHWFRRNRGIHDYEFSAGPLHFCNRTCDEQAQWEAYLEADVGGEYEAHYWDAAEDEEWKRKREERRCPMVSEQQKEESATFDCLAVTACEVFPFAEFAGTGKMKADIEELNEAHGQEWKRRLCGWFPAKNREIESLKAKIRELGGNA